MSVSIHFQDIVKKYGNNTIIPGLNLDVCGKAGFVLLGCDGGCNHSRGMAITRIVLNN